MLAEPMPRQRALRIAVSTLVAGVFSTVPKSVHAADCGNRGMCSDGRCCGFGSTHCCPGNVHCCYKTGPLSVCCGLALCCAPDQVCCPNAHGNGIDNGGGCCPAGSTCCGDSCCVTNRNETCVNGACVTAGCDRLQAMVDAATAQLQGDNASVNDLLEQLQSLSAVVIAQAPELTPLATQVSDALAQLGTMYQDPSVDASSYAAAANAWAQTDGAQQLNDLLAQSPTASSGVAVPIVANMQALLAAAQGLAQTAAADAERLADAQAQFAACQADAPHS